jgi:hypothetical protein
VGYQVSVEGGTVVSTPGAQHLLIKNQSGASTVEVSVVANP